MSVTSTARVSVSLARPVELKRVKRKMVSDIASGVKNFGCHAITTPLSTGKGKYLFGAAMLGLGIATGTPDLVNTTLACFALGKAKGIRTEGRYLDELASSVKIYVKTYEDKTALLQAIATQEMKPGEKLRLVSGLEQRGIDCMDISTGVANVMHAQRSGWVLSRTTTVVVWAANLIPQLLGQAHAALWKPLLVNILLMLPIYVIGRLVGYFREKAAVKQLAGKTKSDDDKASLRQAMQDQALTAKEQARLIKKLGERGIAI